MLELAHALFGVELDHGALGQQGHDARHSELGGLLHDEVHALAARDALQQRDLQRRLAFDSDRAPGLAPRRFLPCGRSSAAEYSPPVPSNKVNGAPAEAQHARQVFARLRGQHDLRTFGECSGHIDSRQAHASSMPSVAMRASSSISSGAMT